MVTTESALSPKSSSLLANNSFSIASLITQQQQQQQSTTLIDSNIDWLKQKSLEIFNSEINSTTEAKSREGLFRPNFLQEA